MVKSFKTAISRTEIELKEEGKTLNEIAEQQYEALLKYCLKRTGGDEQLSRECAAEAFLRANKLGDPPKHPNISGWLRRTAANAIREKRRESKAYYGRNVSLEAMLERGEAPFFRAEREFLGDLLSPEPGPDDEELGRIKQELLGTLPEGDRELIELAYEKKLKLDELAEITGRSKDAVRVKLSRLTDKVTEMARRYFEDE